MAITINDFNLTGFAFPVVTCDYPGVGDVRLGVVYDDSTLTGTLVLPAVSDVLLGIGYGTGGTEFTGTAQNFVLLPRTRVLRITA